MMLLCGWKQIGKCLGMSDRHARRIAKAMRLPVRKIPGGRNASVIAESAELIAAFRKKCITREAVSSLGRTCP